MPWNGTEPCGWPPLGPDGHAGRAASRVAGGRERVDLPARVVARRRAPLRLGPQRLVEPLPPAAGRRGPAGGRRRRRRRGAAVGVPPAPLRLPGRRVDRRRVLLRRPGPASWSTAADGSGPGPARPGTWLSGPVAAGRDLFLLAGSPTSFPAVVRVDTASGELEVLRAPEGPGLDPAFVSVPEPSSSPPPTVRPTPTTTRR